MRWPWVSREAFNILERRRVDAEERIRPLHEHYGAMLTREQARYDALLDKYHALRVAGANPREPDRIIPPPKQPPRPIMHAIRAISPRDDAAYFANLKLYRDNEEKADADPEQFAERIRRGRLTGDEPTPQQAD